MTEPVPDHVLGIVTDAEAERIQQIHDRWKLYEGDHDDSLQVHDGEADDNVTRNSVGTVVDTGVEFLFGEGAAIQVEAKNPEDKKLADDAQLLVDDVMERSGDLTTLSEWAIGGAIAGHAVLKLVIDTPGDATTARLVDQDPATVTAFWAPNDVKRAVAYRTMWTSTDDTTGDPLVLREDCVQQADGTWLLKSWQGRAQSLQQGLMTRTTFQWEQTGEETHWAYQWAPIADCKNLPDPGRYYGRSDISHDVQSLNAGVNRAASNAAKTLRHFAHPQPWATGDDPKKLQASIDASIGALWCLPQGTKLGTMELQPHGLAASAEWIDAAEDKLFETARVPAITRGRVTDLGQLSGVALLVLYRPLLSKTAAKRATYGAALIRTIRHLLEYADIDITRLTVTIAWPDPLPKNQKEETETGLNLKELGVSQQTILEMLGFNPEVEEQRRNEEAADPMGDARGIVDRAAELAGDDPAMGDDEAQQVA